MAKTAKKVVKKHKNVIALEKALLDFTGDANLESLKVKRTKDDGFIVRVDYKFTDKYKEFVIG